MFGLTLSVKWASWDVETERNTLSTLLIFPDNTMKPVLIDRTTGSRFFVHG